MLIKLKENTRNKTKKKNKHKIPPKNTESHEHIN